MQQSNRFLPFGNNNSIQRKPLSAPGTIISAPTNNFLPHFFLSFLTMISNFPGGLPQSLSGSDTDVSTSNENLSNEERYVIRHTARQEPQGQENHPQSPSRSSSQKENIPNIQVNTYPSRRRESFASHSTKEFSIPTGQLDK